MPHTSTPPPTPDELAQHTGHRAATTSPTATPPAAATPPPRYPAQAVPGITQVWRHTLGHPDVIIGVVDGPPDLSHPSLSGANLEAREPWWLPPTPPDPKAVQHGTFTASVLAGRHGTILPGLAPHCRLIMMNHPTTEQHVPDPHSAARAIEELIEAGADIIQYTLAHHTASDDADPMLKRAITHALEAGVLITAPAGNDYGHNSIAPAILPGVLAIGAHRADGAMFYFSNHGPAYHGHGITTLGEAVLGATPHDAGVKARKGTCTAVALVTGAAALLLSLQHHRGQRPDPRAVRDALLATARPCTPDQAHGHLERCLNGYLDLPAAAAHLFPGLDISPPQPAPAPAPISAPSHSATRPSPTATTASADGTATSAPVSIVTLAECPDLAEARPAGQQQQPSSPGFLGNEIAGRWSRLAGLDRRFPEFTFAAADAGGRVVGRGHAVPFALHTPERDGRLPDGGWDEILLWACTDLHHGTAADTLGALSIWVDDAHRGSGLADRLLAAMKHAAHAAGLTELAAPVRPTRKHEEPAVAMADYAHRVRDDGLPHDPWLRTHIRAGGRLAGIAPASMVMAGSLAQWRAWTALPFDADGPVIVPGALVPVHCSLAHDHAVYVEPNIWVRHPLPAPTTSPPPEASHAAPAAADPLGFLGPPLPSTPPAAR